MTDEERSTDPGLAASAPQGVVATSAGVGSTLLNHDEYLKQRESLVAAYTSSINEYDRLVTWASAGALGLSISFLEKFGTNADPTTAWMWGLGWGSLSAAFALSLWSAVAGDPRARIRLWTTSERTVDDVT